jgi:adenosylhomocysteine nucleosidase
LSVTGVVAALDFEARRFGARSAHSLVSVSGIGADNAARAAHSLAAAGAAALLSWGVAGALDPALRSGTAVLPLEVMVAGRRYQTDRLWHGQVAMALQGRVPLVSGALLTSEIAVASAAHKADLFQHSGAVAVDMESAAVAGVAAQLRLPFLALRVILDTARDSLPDSVLRSFEAPPDEAPPGQSRASAGTGAGASSAAPRIWPLLCAPGDWGGLLRLAMQYRLAGRALGACRRLAGPTLMPGAGIAR